MKKYLLFISVVISLLNLAPTSQAQVTQSLSPSIVTSTVTGNISSCSGMASSDPDIEQFAITANNLSGDVNATVTTNFEISINPNNGYHSNIKLTQSGGSLASITIYVRSSARAATGRISAYVTLTTPGLTPKQVGVKAFINPLPVVSAVRDRIFPAGMNTTAINFTGTANNFSWTNDAPGIGLTANGVGNIPSFMAVNNSSDPVIANITVTPYSIPFSYICNQGSNSITVINNNNNTIATTISGGQTPCAVSVNPEGSMVYITNLGDNTVSVINTSTNKVVATVPVGVQPNGILSSPDGSKVYVANFKSNSISVINTATNKVTSNIAAGSGPYAIAMNAAGNRLYVSDYNTNSVSVINTATAAIIATVAVGTNPEGITISPDGSAVYVANNTSNSVSVISTANNTQVTTIATGTHPAGIVLNLDGTRLYVTNKDDNNISVINTANNTVISSVAVGEGPIGLSLSKDGDRLYVVNSGSGTVAALSTVNNDVIYTIKVGERPTSMGNFVASGSDCTGLPVKFKITVAAPAIVPVISPGVVSGQISACTGSASASPNIQQFTVSGKDLAGDITARAPTGFELSLSPLNGYANSVSVSKSVGNAGSTVIYVRSSVTASRLFYDDFERANTSLGVLGKPTLGGTYDLRGPGLTHNPPTSKIYDNRWISASTDAADYAIQTLKTTEVKRMGANVSWQPGNGGTNPGVYAMLISADTVGHNFYLNTAIHVIINRTAWAVQHVSNSEFITVAKGNFPVKLKDDGSPYRMEVTLEGTTLNYNFAGVTGSCAAPAFLTKQGPYATFEMYYAGSSVSDLVRVDDMWAGLAGDISGDVILTSPGAIRQNVTVNGNLEELPIVNPVSSQTVVNGTAIPAIKITGTAGSYSWVNDTPGIGLQANGIGQVPSFTAINTGDDPITATITVTPLSATPGGCNGNSVTFTITANPSPRPVLSATGILSAQSTTYGTPSIPQIFSVSGINLTAGILVTPPTGFEVSIDGVTFSSTITVGSTDNVVSAPIYIRLAAASPAGNYNGNIVLTARRGNTVNQLVPVSTITPAPLSVIAKDVIKQFGTTLAGGAGFTDFISTGLQNGESIGSVNITYGPGASATAAIGVYNGSVKLSNASGGTFVTGNYAITYIPAAINVVRPTINAVGALSPLNTVYGTPSSSGSFIVSGTNLSGTILIKVPAEFEISIDGTNFSSSLTLGGGDEITSTPVYIRLAAITPAGSYSGNIVLSSTGANNISEAIPLSAVTKAQLTITVNDKTKPIGADNPALTVTYTGFVNEETPAVLTTPLILTTIGTNSSIAGKYAIVAKGAVASNYNILYVDGFLTVLPDVQFIVIPNTFTPNGDGVNDTWAIKNLDYFQNITVNIFDRFNRNMYYSNGYGTPWDGQYKGTMLPMGTYYYIINLKNEHKLLSGYVTIVR